jgi:hypothetical protein
MPVARRDLGQQRQHRVAEIAGAWDHAPGLAREQPIRLGVVDLATRDGRHEQGQLGWIHLVVRRHHDDDVDVLRERPLVARHDRRADSAVALVDDDLRPGVRGLPRPGRGLVRRGVVDDEYAVDGVRDAAKRRPDEVLLAVCGYDDGDTLALDHRSRC